MTTDVSPVYATESRQRPGGVAGERNRLRYRPVTPRQAGALAAMTADWTRLADEAAAIFPGHCQRAWQATM
jgi:hypothetical protein